MVFIAGTLSQTTKKQGKANTDANNIVVEESSSSDLMYARVQQLDDKICKWTIKENSQGADKIVYVNNSFKLIQLLIKTNLMILLHEIFGNFTLLLQNYSVKYLGM